MSRGLEPGDAASPFDLPDANSDGPENCNLSDLVTDIGCIVMFTCNHCPYVIGNESRIESVASRAREEGMGFVGINSNDPDNYPTDNWDHMVKRAATMSYPYLHDASQEVAREWGAERTPETVSVVPLSGRCEFAFGAPCSHFCDNAPHPPTSRG